MPFPGFTRVEHQQPPRRSIHAAWPGDSVAWSDAVPALWVLPEEDRRHAVFAPAKARGTGSSLLAAIRFTLDLQLAPRLLKRRWPSHLRAGNK